METGLRPGRDNCGPGYEYETRIMIGVSILFVLLILDILTTQIILSCGGVEYNPLMAGIVRNPVVHVLVKMLFLSLVVLVAKYSEIRLKGSGTMLFFVIIGWYIICLGHNLGSILNPGPFT